MHGKYPFVRVKWYQLTIVTRQCNKEPSGTMKYYGIERLRHWKSGWGWKRSIRVHGENIDTSEPWFGQRRPLQANNGPSEETPAMQEEITQIRGTIQTKSVAYRGFMAPGAEMGSGAPFPLACQTGKRRKRSPLLLGYWGGAPSRRRFWEHRVWMKPIFE